jgi:hypothetical protein
MDGGLNIFYTVLWLNTIAGHRHRGRGRRNQHSGIYRLNPVLEHSCTLADGTKLVPFIGDSFHSGTY